MVKCCSAPLHISRFQSTQKRKSIQHFFVFSASVQTSIIGKRDRSTDEALIILMNVMINFRHFVRYLFKILRNGAFESLLLPLFMLNDEYNQLRKWWYSLYKLVDTGRVCNTRDIFIPQYSILFQEIFLIHTVLYACKNSITNLFPWLYIFCNAHMPSEWQRKLSFILYHGHCITSYSGSSHRKDCCTLEGKLVECCLK